MYKVLLSMDSSLYILLLLDWRRTSKLRHLDSAAQNKTASVGHRTSCKTNLFCLMDSADTPANSRTNKLGQIGSNLDRQQRRPRTSDSVAALPPPREIVAHASNIFITINLPVLCLMDRAEGLLSATPSVQSS